MRKIIFLGLLVTLFATVAAFAQDGDFAFRGGLGGKRIEITLKRSGGSIGGTYIYTKFRKPLTLKGSINADGSFTMTETDGSGASNGTFEGKWETGADGIASLSGTWKAKKNDTHWDFWADQQAIYFSGSQSIETRSATENYKAKLAEITTAIPILKGFGTSDAKFNATAQRIVSAAVASFKKDMATLTADDVKRFKEMGVGAYLEADYSVMLADENVVSILFSFSTFEGGAHPNHYSRSLNFDLKTGRELALKDLFKPRSNYLSVISKYCIADLKRSTEEMSDDEWLKNGAGPKASNFSSWNLTRTALHIEFDPYQVAAYAAGPQEVAIPFSELRSIAASRLLK